MAEKVIFEFRAEEGEDGYRFEFRNPDLDCMGLTPFLMSCCQTAPMGGLFGGRASSKHSRAKARRRMRNTLDFFQKMYDDLYGEDEVSGEEESPAD